MKYVTLLLTLGWFLFSTYLSHQTGAETYQTSLHLAEMLGNDEWNGWLRKAAHVVVFLVLSILASVTLKYWDFDWRFVLLVFLWAVVDEANKPLVDGRYFAWFDVFLNLVGCLIEIVVGWIVC